MMRMGESVAIAAMLSVLAFSFCMAAAVTKRFGGFLWWGIREHCKDGYPN